MNNQSLIVAGLIHQDPAIHQQMLKEQPHIARFLKQYQAYPQDSINSDQLLGSFFGLDADKTTQTTASICYFAEFNQKTTDYWFHFDPVHLKADRDHLLLFDGAYLEIKTAEATQLIQECTEFYADLNWKLVYKTPHRWYLGLTEPLDLKAVPLEQVTGHSIMDQMPTGKDAKTWRGILNEIQMLFFQSSINQQRQAQAEPIINGVWLSAGGQLPEITPHIQQIWQSSPHLLVQGLAKLANIRLIEQLNLLDFKAPKATLLYYQEMEQALLTGEHQNWLNAIAEFEQWLKQHQSILQKFDLYPLNGHYYSPKKPFWKQILRR